MRGLPRAQKEQIIGVHKMTSEFTEDFKQMAKRFGYDFSQEGKRIKLIYTSDPYTHLKIGDLGTIRFRHFNYDCFVLVVKWDNGRTLGLIEGKDSYEVLK